MTGWSVILMTGRPKTVTGAGFHPDPAAAMGKEEP